MPSENNRRRSLRSRVTSYKNKTPPPKQTHLTPLNRVIKRTYSKSSSTGPASRWQDTTLTQCGYVLPQESEEIDFKSGSKQSRSTSKRKSGKSFETQTLTQGGFVFYQSPADENMAYNEGVGTVQDSPSHNRKRRRNELEEPITSRTRSAKKRAAEHIVKNEDDVDKKDGLELIPIPIPSQNLATVSMPPPKTPQSTRRREVPSSQSPADTPLSTVSRRSRDMLRSPLKAKSVNVRRRIDSSVETKSWARMGVAADSLECEDEDEEEPQKSSHSSASAIPIKFESTNDTLPPSAPCDSQIEDHAGARPEETVPTRAGPCPKRKGGEFKFEISDSDNDLDQTDEDEIDCGSEFEFGVSKTNLETGSSTQVVAESDTGFKISESDQTPKPTTRVAELANTSPRTESELEKSFKTPRPARKARTPAASPTQHSRKSDHRSALHHDCHHLPAKSPSNFHVFTISSPAENPVPLNNHLSPQPSPCVFPEPESQPQHPWRDSYPPTADTSLLPDPPVTHPKLPTYPASIQQQQQHPPPQHLAPIPPSQATTVDVTQHSSSPPQLPDNDADNPPDEPDTLARDIGGWEAVRLSDSQLQLDSLIDDTALSRPPPVSILSSSPMRSEEEERGGRTRKGRRRRREGT